MSLIIPCSRCPHTIDQPGALIFGPPSSTDGFTMVAEKMHLCVGCYEDLQEWLGTSSEEQT